MKAISLWQPWASLVAIGAKRIETRHWYPPDSVIGKRIYIHAAKRWTREEQEVCELEPFNSVLQKHFGLDSEFPPLYRSILPLGALVGTAILRMAVPTERCRMVSHEWLPVGYKIGAVEVGRTSVDLSPQEVEFGNYGKGRFAWLLEDISLLAEPIPYAGTQGFFEVAI
jgi:hypothetical protein